MLCIGSIRDVLCGPVLGGDVLRVQQDQQPDRKRHLQLGDIVRQRLARLPHHGGLPYQLAVSLTRLIILIAVLRVAK